MVERKVKIDFPVDKLSDFKDPADIAEIFGVDYAKGGENKAKVDELVTVMNEFNGAFNAAEAGVGAAYIPASTYFHVCTEDKGATTEITTDKRAEIIELYYNWRALGRNRNAIYGAAIRYGARNLVDLNREVVQIRTLKISADQKEDFATFRSQLEKEKLNAAIWAKQFPSILAMNGACLVAISHHWDSENTKPWDAMVQSLGQADVITSDAYRVMFYLALHPIPLTTVESYRAQAAEGKLTFFVNAVAIRARCTPATTGALVVSAAAFNDLKAEPYAAEIKGLLRVNLEAHAQVAAAIRDDPASYCPLATVLGKERKILDHSAYKLSMIILTSYILECVKGTLARSASLKKFQNANSRTIQRWRTLFAAHVEREAGTLLDELRTLSVPA